MDDKRKTPLTESRRGYEASLLPTFETMADEYLNTVTGAGNGKNGFESLGYLDGKVEIGGTSYTRRIIVLAIQDMKEAREAPAALQDKTLEQAMSLSLQPVPQLKLYRDIATAVLRIEMAIRLAAQEAFKEGPAKLSADNLARPLTPTGFFIYL